MGERVGHTELCGWALGGSGDVHWDQDQGRGSTGRGRGGATWLGIREGVATWLVQAVLADEEQLGDQLCVRLGPEVVHKKKKKKK